MTRGIALFVVVGILALGLWAYYSGTQVQGCIYLQGDFIVCEEGWGVLGSVS